MLAVSSGGGHWEQLQLLRDGLCGCDIWYATTGPAESIDNDRPVTRIPDTNRRQPWQVVRCTAAAISLVRRCRPDVVITTGALPGLICLIVGRLSGAQTIWVDSAANSAKLSMSGVMAKRFATLWITQWDHLARPGGPVFFGNLL